MNVNKLPIAFINGTVATTNGVYRISDIDFDTVRGLVKERPYFSNRSRKYSRNHDRIIRGGNFF